MSYDLIRSQRELHTLAYVVNALYELAAKCGFVSAKSARVPKDADDTDLSVDCWWIPVEHVANLAKTLQRSLEDLELHPESVDLDSIEEKAKSWIRSPRGKEHIKNVVGFCEAGGLQVLG